MEMTGIAVQVLILQSIDEVFEQRFSVLLPALPPQEVRKAILGLEHGRMTSLVDELEPVEGLAVERYWILLESPVVVHDREALGRLGGRGVAEAKEPFLHRQPSKQQRLRVDVPADPVTSPPTHAISAASSASSRPAAS